MLSATVEAPLDKIKQSQAALALDRCPPPSRNFQGRQDILAKMDEYFSRDIGETHVYVLHGLGGSGKTQIALKFLTMTNKPSTPRYTLLYSASFETANCDTQVYKTILY
jgi:hypothetical protein